MTRYIDADKLLEKLETAKVLQSVPQKELDVVKEQINTYADKHPAPVFEWTAAFWTIFPDTYVCLNCRTAFSGANFNDWKYCPKCGTRMEKEKWKNIDID